MTTEPIKPTPFTEVDAIAARLTTHKQQWLQVNIPERITYLQSCVQGVLQVAADWAAAACRAKGIDPESSLAGEEWIAGPLATVMNLQQLIQALQPNGAPPPSHWRTLKDQSIAQVFPQSLQEKLLWLGFKAEVWLQPQKPTTQGAIYRNHSAPGRLALVLGAGNISAIAPTDSLYKLFVENQVVLLKMNPVNEYIGPFLEQAFQSLRQASFFELVYGGADLGQYLCQHPQIDTIHITGSHHTHDAIVWGSTAVEQAERKAAHHPRITKPISSELGSVTPVLVVPGPWTAAEITFQARHVASMVVHNASFNCVAAKVLVTAQGWPQQSAFLQEVHQQLARIPTRQAYYPGAQQRYQQFLARYPQARPLGAGGETVVPWTVIPDVPAQAGEYALSEEAFCGLLAEVSLNGQDAREFLHQAVDFANERVWGNLSCVVLIHPATRKALGEEFEQAIARLRHGNIGINVWTGVSFLMGVTTWGAYPGNLLADICSGQGVVHNTYLFDYPQKSVVYAPFRIWPTPVWFADHRNLRQLGQQLIRFTADPTWINLSRVFWSALRGEIT